jgi:hypothetical protein
LHPIQAFWHVAGFLVVPVLLGGFAALATRLIWHRDLAMRSLWRLWAWASAAAVATSFAGLVVTGQDGRMATYAAMVLASALALWWTGFRVARR